MHKILLAASLIAGFGGFVATSAAHADEFNGTAQSSTEYFPYGRNAPPVFDMVPATPNAYVPPPSTGTGIDTTPFLSKSHGRP